MKCQVAETRGSPDGHAEKLRFKDKWTTCSSVQFSCSVVSDSLPTYGLPVHHQLLEFTKTQVHWLSDAVQPTHPLSSHSRHAFNLSQHQDLFQRVSSHQVAKYGCFSFTISWRMVNEWIVWTNFLEVGLVGYPCSLRDSQESSPTLQLKSINSSALSFLYSPTLTSIRDYWKNHSFD